MSSFLFALEVALLDAAVFTGYSRSGLYYTGIYYSMLFWHLQFLLQVLMCFPPCQTICYLNLVNQNYLFILRCIYTYVFMYVHHIHSWPKKSEEGIKSFGTRFIDNYEPLCGIKPRPCTRAASVYNTEPSLKSLCQWRYN